ncbi:hypothetical protein FGADI_4436 [Fusarium gaditjirri]|uniref:F-box domain-containing protein n=1 Tax=Fusarium gaditjirri TaxID=282569 RepID=A0A8H4TD47_9HYPO|nr:hypothetical protein FGADI_4436 [Fusarium gaditjirri]
MAPVSLLDCPDEVIDSIIKLLPGSAIKASRLTSKRVSRIASPYLFPVLYISCHQLDLDVFRLVSENPLLIGGVRELVIDDTTVPPSVRDWPTYQKVVTFPRDADDRRDHLDLDEDETLSPDFMNGEPSDIKPSEEAWKLFSSTAQGHHENRLAHADFDALKRALPLLKNLKSLVLSNRMVDDRFSEGAQSSVSSSPVVKMWRRFEGEGYLPLPPRCDWHPTTQGLQDRTPVNTMDWLDDRLVIDITKKGVSDMTALQSTYDLFVEQYTNAREARVIFLALLVLEDPKLQSQLSEFRVDATYDILSEGHQPGLAITLFDRQSPLASRLGSGFAAATNITKFDLTLSNFPYVTTTGEAIVEEGKVRRIFETMLQLEELYLEPHGMPIFSILPEMTFPRLRFVQFSCGHLHPKMFLDFVRRHGGTLKTLIVEHCSLRPRDKELPWREITNQLKEFHDQGILQLEEGSNIDNVFEHVPMNDCGKNETLLDFGQIWKFDDGKWDRWLEGEVNQMLPGAFDFDLTEQSISPLHLHLHLHLQDLTGVAQPSARMAACHILKLPDEIHVAVAKLLPGSALKTARATCRKLNNIASSRLYPVLYLSCHQLDLDVFRLVASNPLLIGGVKELVIDDTTLSPRLADWEVYKTVASYPQYWPDRKNAYCWGDKFEQEGRIWSDEPDQEYWALFKSVLKGHHENRQSHADITALKQALPLFKSLRSLVITNRTADEDFDSGAQSQESSSPVFKMWRRLGVSKQERPPFPPRCDWIAPWHEPGFRTEVMHLDFFNDELDRALKENALPPANGVEKEPEADNQFAGGNPTSRNWLEEEAFCRIVGREARAVFIALEVLRDKRLTEFRVDASFEVDGTESFQPGLPILLFDSNESPFPSELTPSFFSCMTKFHLVLSNYWDAGTGEFIGEDSMCQGNITRLLASMPQLEDLLLEPHGMPIFSAIPDITFSQLRRIEFSCGEIDPQKLVSFIERHAPTLKFITVQYCFIDPGMFEETWEHVMRDIRLMQDAKTLDIYDGEVAGVYGGAPCQGCGRNNTLDVDWRGCRSWEFVMFSMWRQYHDYPWDLQSDEDSENDDDGSDEGGSDEGGNVM